MMPLAQFAAFALMTAIAALVVLWPLGRARALKEAREADLAVYRDQLAEIARDKESGRLPAGEAEAARIEVARRMLAADTQRGASAQDEASATSGASSADSSAAVRRRRIAAIAALVVIPACAVGLYSLIGSPGLPGAPLAARLAAPPDRGDVAILVRRVEEHLARNPNDGQGYEILAPVYLRLGRLQDAARAQAQVIRLLGATAERQAALGETLVVAAGGIVSAEAQAAFNAALALDPREPRALYFSALAAEQDGRPADAAAVLRRMITSARPDAPYLPMVKAALARAEAASGGGSQVVADPNAPARGQSSPSGAPPAAAPGPTAADMAAAADMSEQDRSAMVRGMVARLEARLAAEPKDLDGWLRLARAFTVLNDRAKAEGALKAARAAFDGNPEALARIDAAARDLGSGG